MELHSETWEVCQWLLVVLGIFHLEGGVPLISQKHVSHKSWKKILSGRSLERRVLEIILSETCKGGRLLIELHSETWKVCLCLSVMLGIFHSEGGVLPPHVSHKSWMNILNRRLSFSAYFVQIPTRNTHITKQPKLQKIQKYCSTLCTLDVVRMKIMIFDQPRNRGVFVFHLIPFHRSQTDRKTFKLIILLF